jgi:hypothetical protein
MLEQFLNTDKMKRVTFIGMQIMHPEFEFERTNGSKHISVTHKETGKQVVCIVGDRVKDYNDFVERVKADPDFYLNSSSYFRHTKPTHPNPYHGGMEVVVTVDNDDIKNHFGHTDFCKTGDVLEIKDAGWSDLHEAWLPSFDNPNDFGGFWLRPDMVEIL